MTIIQKLKALLRKKLNFLSLLETKTFGIQKFNPLFLLSFIVIFTGLFFASSNLINFKNKENTAHYPAKNID